MEFKDYFRNDLEHIGCSLSDLSRVSGLSSAVLSRYRSGERIPRKESELLVKLCSGLSELEAQAGIPPLGRDRLEFYRSVLSDDTLLLSQHFDSLLRSLQISMKELSRALNYDASYLSRIRSGKRSPSDPNMFAAHVSRVLIDNAKDADLDTIRDLIQADQSDTLENQLTRWLLQKDHQQTEGITSFLSKLDEFDLDEFIRLLDFARDGSIPAPKIVSSHQFGQPALRQAEISFLSATAAGCSSDSIFMCNEMPIIDMASDSEYIKTWMTLIAACLKKGMHLNIIHDINRPFSEMMIGLEGWIPIYMTGEISPYYLPEEGNSIYRHCLYVSQSAALLAECIRGKSEHGVTWITEKKRILNTPQPARRIFSAPQNR